jgi:hypothetical protein
VPAKTPAILYAYSCSVGNDSGGEGSAAVAGDFSFFATFFLFVEAVEIVRLSGGIETRL